MSTSSEIGERVAQARREKGVRERRDITQREVAKDIGVSPTTISDCESGKQIPGERVIQSLARYLGVTPAFLRYGVGIETTKPASAAGGLAHLRDNAVLLTPAQIARAEEKAAQNEADRAAAKNAPPRRRRGTTGRTDE